MAPTITDHPYDHEQDCQDDPALIAMDQAIEEMEIAMREAQKRNQELRERKAELELQDADAKKREAEAGSRVVCVMNAVDPEDLEDDEDYADVCSLLTDMFSKSGEVEAVHIPRPSQGEAQGGEAYIMFGTAEAARHLQQTLNGKVLGDRRLKAAIIPDVVDAQNLMPACSNKGSMGESTDYTSLD